MTFEELFQAAKAGQIEQIVGQLFSGLPFAFADKPSDYSRFRGQLGNALKCDADNISVVGSGRFGYSLAPHKLGRKFHDRSDLDVVIVHADFFDRAWVELIRYDFRSMTFERDVAQSLRDHRSNHVFWGYMEPYNLKTALSAYKKVWFPAFAALGFLRSAAGRTVKARVYRTWEHAKNYHRYGIRLIGAKERSEEE